MEDISITASDGQEWFILRHPKPKMIDDILSHRKQVAGSTDGDSALLSPIDYYIPFCDMSFHPSKERPQASAGIDGSYNPMMDGNALRNDLHSFVFIHGSEQLVNHLIRSTWNRSLKFPMIVWRDGSGRLIRVPDREMELFKNAIRKQDFQVCVGQPLDDIRTGDKVVVVDGPMKDSNGVVTAICERKGRIMLTISFWMFNDMMHPQNGDEDIILPNVTESETFQLYQKDKPLELVFPEFSLLCGIKIVGTNLSKTAKTLLMSCSKMNKNHESVRYTEHGAKQAVIR